MNNSPGGVDKSENCDQGSFTDILMLDLRLASYENSMQTFNKRITILHIVNVNRKVRKILEESQEANLN